MNQSHPTNPTDKCTGELNCPACVTVCHKRLRYHRAIAIYASDVLNALHSVAPSLAEQFPPALGLQRALVELEKCRKEQEER